jgi:hypothetical protein
MLTAQALTIAHIELCTTISNLANMICEHAVLGV